MVCCILFNLCILQGYLHLPKHPTINYTKRVIFVFYVVIHTLVKMYACLKSKENNKYAKSISEHVVGNDLGAVSMKKQRKFSCYGFVKTGKPPHSIV